MDLRGMLNDNGPAAAAAASSSKPPQPQQIQIQTQGQPQPPPTLPSTPVQTIPQQPVRDYSQTQQSPIRQYSQDYGSQNVPPAGAFASSPFQGSHPQYPNRPPQPPPLQQIAPNDFRSPSIGSGPAPSPYRPTPTSSISTASGGYPFPPPQQTPTSPVQRHQYPHTSTFHREGYSQPPGAAGGVTGPPGASSYMQGPPLPQTPPIGTAAATGGGGPHPYPHQRSQSSQSTTTPTSAQSQSGAQYGAPYVHGSPVATTRPLPSDHQQRHSSQPPTPIAGPLSAGPRPGQTLNFPQPPSPYQQRLSSAAAPAAYHPLPSQSQTSPPPPPPPSLPRHPSSQSIYDSHSQDTNRRPPSHSERDRSVSISPKTRVPSLPSSAGRPSTSVSETEVRPSQAQHASALAPAIDVDRERDLVMAPAKRKLEDRELRPDELERREVRPAPFENVADRSVRPDPAAATHASAPVKRPRKKTIHKTPPVWAQTMQGRKLANPNYILYRASAASHNHQVNGKSESLVSRHASPEERRSTLVPQAGPPPPAAAQPATQQITEAPHVDPFLGPWEPSLNNEAPQGGISMKLCQFFWQTIVNNEQRAEMHSRGVKFEIEAKLGTLVDKGSNQRLHVPVESECVLAENPGWYAFRSSMTENQHKHFNNFLNELLKSAHPDNKANAGRRRLVIDYRHRREVDKFFDLPDNVMDEHLPPYVAHLVASSGRRPSVRVTYAQKTNEVLAKIVKARIADTHLYLPGTPFDCRVSVNLEMDWDGPIEALENSGKASRSSKPDRNKDRLSYIHGPYQVDLTQVTQGTAQRQERQHELEIEINPDTLIEQAERTQAGQPQGFAKIVDGFVNNIRLLAREAKSFS